MIYSEAFVILFNIHNATHMADTQTNFFSKQNLLFELPAAA